MKWLLHHDTTTTHAFFFDQKQHDCRPSTNHIFLFSKLKIKLKGRLFETVKMIEAESWAMLNTLTKCDFQDAFQSWQKRCKWCVHAEGNYFESYGGQ
jgi:hypothetical protein